MFCSWYQEKFKFLKPEAPLSPVMAHSVMREEGKATLLTLQFLPKSWMLTSSLALSLMLFWPWFAGYIGRKQFALSEAAHWRLAQSKCEPQHELGGIGRIITWEQARRDCGNPNLNCLNSQGKVRIEVTNPSVLWCNSCWYADLPHWRGEFATVNT